MRKKRVKWGPSRRKYAHTKKKKKKKTFLPFRDKNTHESNFTQHLDSYECASLRFSFSSFFSF